MEKYGRFMENSESFEIMVDGTFSPKVLAGDPATESGWNRSLVWSSTALLTIVAAVFSEDWVSVLAKGLVYSLQITARLESSIIQF